jgi:hypothetical protein
MAGGIFISYSDYSKATIDDCRDLLTKDKIIVLCRIEELVKTMESRKDVKQLFHEKIDKAVIYKDPYFIF